MRQILKDYKSVFYKGNHHFKNKKKKTIYLQESIDFFARNIVKDLPFMSKHVTNTYNKYLLNKYRDKLCRIKNFLNSKTLKNDDLAQAFEKLNFIRIKIMILERDINAYRNALKYSFDAKDTNIVLQKRIHKKYAKLRKFDTYQNLTLGVIYDQSILADKIKKYEDEANKNAERITKKYDSSETLQSMQKEFIYTIIMNRQNQDKIFIQDVEIDFLQDLLRNNPKYIYGLSNIETFTNEYLSHNPGALSKKFVKFIAEHKKTGINAIVKDYLKLYKEIHPESTTAKLNEIQKELLTSFTYKDFKNSEIFNSIDTAMSTNNILLKAKIAFAKAEMCQELEFCLDLPEINNYFKIIENKEHIKNYLVSTERLFVRKIEEEFPEIKKPSFIYLYNKVKNLLETYQVDILSYEQFYINDLVNTILYNEFPKPNDKTSVLETLEDISIGILKNPASIDAKNNFDLFNKLLVQFYYIKAVKNMDFEEKLANCKLFHGVLVDKEMKPILPLNIQTKIINLPLEAQISLARNYHNSSILELVDDFNVSDTGELRIGKSLVEFGINSNNSIKRLALTQQISLLNDYLTINKDNYYLEDELNLAKYIQSGIEDTFKDCVYENISTDIPDGNFFKVEEISFEELGNESNKPDIPSITNDTPLKEEENIATNEEEKKEVREVIDFKKAKKYIDLILKEENKNKQAKMLLRIQKRVNSKDLYLSDVQIDNLNEKLNPISLSLRSPKSYVDHLIEKYRTEKRDINSLQVGLKLRIRMGYLILTDDEINKINEDYNFELVQRSKLVLKREKCKLSMKYLLKGTIDDFTKEKLNNISALVRSTAKKKSNKINQLDIVLYNILSNDALN